MKAYEIGSLVFVTSYGPYWGFRGVIHAVDAVILAEAQEALYFYLVALQEGKIKDPVWLVHDDIAIIEGESEQT